MDEVAMSPGRIEMSRDFMCVSSACLEGEGDVMVEGRKRTVIWVLGGAFEARAARTAFPSSPAPRTRMEADIGADLRD